jgi:hypothetical protein
MKIGNWKMQIGGRSRAIIFQSPFFIFHFSFAATADSRGPGED